MHHDVRVPEQPASVVAWAPAGRRRRSGGEGTGRSGAAPLGEGEWFGGKPVTLLRLGDHLADRLDRRVGRDLLNVL